MRTQILACVLGSVMAGAPLAAMAEEAPVQGVWIKHEYLLSYAGFTSHYSCIGIEDKVRDLLLAAGARDDVKVVGSCSNPMEGPSRITAARMTFYTLAPPGTEQPVPKPKKGRPATPAPPPEPGTGMWKTVEWRNKTPYWLEYGDCELVDQFDREVLPMFTTRNHQSHMTCVPHEVMLGGIQVRFEVLAPLPKAAKPQ